MNFTARELYSLKQRQGTLISDLVDDLQEALSDIERLEQENKQLQAQVDAQK